MERPRRGADGAGRRRLRGVTRSGPRAGLDRGGRGRPRRGGPVRREVAPGRSAPAAAGRTALPPPRRRNPARGQVHPVRACGRIPRARALDERRPDGRAPDLRASGVRARRRGAPRDVRQAAHRPALAAPPLDRPGAGRTWRAAREQVSYLTVTVVSSPSSKCGLPPSRSGNGQNRTYLPGFCKLNDVTSDFPPSSTEVTAGGPSTKAGGLPLDFSALMSTFFDGFPLTANAARRWIDSLPLLSKVRFCVPGLRVPEICHL